MASRRGHPARPDLSPAPLNLEHFSSSFPKQNPADPAGFHTTPLAGASARVTQEGKLLREAAALPPAVLGRGSPQEGLGEALWVPLR